MKASRKLCSFRYSHTSSLLQRAGEETILRGKCTLPLEAFHLADISRITRIKTIEAYCHSGLNKIKYYVKIASMEEKEMITVRTGNEKIAINMIRRILFRFSKSYCN